MDHLKVEHFRSLIENGYSLDLVFLLTLFNEGYDLSKLRETNKKIDVLVNTLMRKGLIDEALCVTKEGKALLDYVADENVEEFALERKVLKDDDFDKWWKAYPGTDTFVHKGKSFSGSRSMRVRKDDCKVKMNKILSEGEYTMDEMIAALELDVLQKKENSIKTNSNKLSYMQNSLTYLNQRSFEPYIELVRSNQTVKESSTAVDATDV
jgi:hypothetical protein